MCLSPRVRIKTWQVQVKIHGYPSLLRGDYFWNFFILFSHTLLNHLTIPKIILYMMQVFAVFFFIVVKYKNIKVTIVTTFNCTIQ